MGKQRGVEDKFKTRRVAQRASALSALALAMVCSVSGCSGEATGTTSTDGEAAVLSFTGQPKNSTAGSSFGVVITALDNQGKAATSFGGNVTVAITKGTGTAGANLSGAQTLSAVGGVATFGGIAIDSAGAGYTLTASATGVASATSSAFDVAPGTAARLVFRVPPSNVKVGALITPPVQVAILDSLGNTVTGASTVLAVAIATNPAGGLLSGTMSRAAVNGIATFADLGVDRFGRGYALSASATGLAGATSGLFDVSVASIAPQVSAGLSHTCAVTSGGAAYCWGTNTEGQLGDGTTTSAAMPVAVQGGLTFQTLSAGQYHTCGLTGTGDAYCWGGNAHGELGDGTTTERTTPVAVRGGLTFQALSAGLYYTCGLTSAGAAYCWGYNYDGQLGDGTTTDRTAPAPVQGGLPFQALTAGGLTAAD